MKKAKREDGEYVYTTFITLKNGKRLYASTYGLKAFRIPASKNK